jgi:adenylate cyclase
MERKLAAILSADVQGYSRLMGQDEEATVHTLTAYRAVMTHLIEQHRGRVVDAPGDNLLAEFVSVVDAVQCATAIQQELARRNAALPEARQMRLRIGINLGDVLVDGARIYGDGVNIAARVEGLAEGGGICISGTVYDQVENKVALTFDYIGEQTVKNIARPIRVYRVVREGEVQQAGTTGPASPRGARHSGFAPGRPGATQGKPAVVPQDKRRKFLVTGVVVLVVIGVLGWEFRHWFTPPRVEEHQREGGKERRGATGLQPAALEGTGSFDKQRVAVLPFVNMSQEAEHEYFVDGITEELISKLSRIGSLRVIARTSVMTYKGKQKTVQEIGRELKIGTILEGSVRKAGDRLRITAQLIDVASEDHLWSQDYEREFTDIFAVQSDVAQKVAEALQVKLVAGEKHEIAKKGTSNLEAYTL